MYKILSSISFAILCSTAFSQAQERIGESPVTRCGCQANKPDENVIAFNNLSDTLARYIVAQHNPMLRENNFAQFCYTIADSIRKSLNVSRIPASMHKQFIIYIAKHLSSESKRRTKSMDEITSALLDLSTSLSHFLSITIDSDMLEESSKKAAAAITQEIKNNLQDSNVPQRKHRDVLNAIARHLTNALE